MSTFTAKFADAHAHPQGAGDARPTASDVIEYYKLQGKMTDKVILVTGCTPGGLGVETAKALQQTGAQLYMTVRDSKKCAEVVDDVHSVYKQAKKPVLLDLDLGSLASVRQCAEQFLQQSQQLNILICNAGVMACPEGKTVDGFETQLGVNHFGHFLLIQLLLPTLIKSSQSSFNSRVVLLSSAGHANYQGQPLDDMTGPLQPYDPMIAYGRSKTCNTWTANEIDRRYGSQGVHGFSVQPGGIHSNLSRHLDPDTWKQRTSGPVAVYMKDRPQGASTTVWAAVSPDWEGHGGKYLNDCAESQLRAPDSKDKFTGHVDYTYDKDRAAKMYDESLNILCLPKQVAQP